MNCDKYVNCPPPEPNFRKLSHSVIRLVGLGLLCCLLALTLCGCGNNARSDEEGYANFVQWQARYAAEKELIGLLREYDVVYKWYADYKEKTKYSLPTEGAITISFVLEGETFLTDEHITLIQVGKNEQGDYYVEITFDEIGAAIFADITANNIGKSIEIEETLNGQSSLIASPSISSEITGKSVQINGEYTEETANYVLVHITGQAAERSVKRNAIAYNDKASENATRTSFPEYLPASLATEPTFDDVSGYLAKAAAAGFIE